MFELGLVFWLFWLFLAFAFLFYFKKVKFLEIVKKPSKSQEANNSSLNETLIIIKKKIYIFLILLE